LRSSLAVLAASVPAILSRAVLDMSTGEITPGVVDDAAEIVGEAAEHQTA
jgi:hypothetical protein